MESMDFDTTPTNETCGPTLIGVDNSEAQNAEAKRMLELLAKRFPEVSGSFRIKRNPHDFGDYPSIEFRTRDEDELLFVEKFYPDTWDDDAPVSMGDSPQQAFDRATAQEPE